MRGYRADIAFDGERALPGGALVLVDGGVIVGVEPASAPVPDDCAVTHLPGTALLPGLIDTHVHLCADSSPGALDLVPDRSPAELRSVVATALQQHLRAGVTAVRDLGDHRWTVVDLGQPDDAPTIVAAGPPLTTPQGHCWSMGGEVAGTAALRQAVRERADRGAAVVKIMASGGTMTAGTDVQHSQFGLDEIRAVVEEAHRIGLPVTAHAHPVQAVEDALAAGVDGIEHCSCMTSTGFHPPPGLLDRLARSGVHVCPTLGRVPGIAPPPTVQAVLERMGATWEDLLAHIGAMHRAGVTMVSGVDAGIGPGKPHGLLPVAVSQLVDCGVPVEAALASATSVAARACHLEQRTGRLAVGLDADLLLVDGDPLADVDCLQRPRSVVSRGREVPLSGPAPGTRGPG
jgi:imidazolonepropionase-like amidohydrolase